MRTNCIGFIGTLVKPIRLSHGHVAGRIVTFNSTDYTNGEGDRKSNLVSDTSGNKNYGRPAVKIAVS